MVAPGRGQQVRAADKPRDGEALFFDA
jgi:hypothetical protein